MRHTTMPPTPPPHSTGGGGLLGHNRFAGGADLSVVALRISVCASSAFARAQSEESVPQFGCDRLTALHGHHSGLHAMQQLGFVHTTALQLLCVKRPPHQVEVRARHNGDIFREQGLPFARQLVPYIHTQVTKVRDRFGVRVHLDYAAWRRHTQVGQPVFVQRLQCKTVCTTVHHQPQGSSRVTAIVWTQLCCTLCEKDLTKHNALLTHTTNHRWVSALTHIINHRRLTNNLVRLLSSV